MITQQTGQTVFVAVPYYGALTLPPLGLSRVFFAAAVDTVTKKITRIEIQVWDPKKEPNLSVWMRGLGVSGVICSDSGYHYQIALNVENIWVLGKQNGEVAELVERWAAGELEAPNGTVATNNPIPVAGLDTRTPPEWTSSTVGQTRSYL